MGVGESRERGCDISQHLTGTALESRLQKERRSTWLRLESNSVRFYGVMLCTVQVPVVG